MRHTFVRIAQSLPEGLVKQPAGHSQSMDAFGVCVHAPDGFGKGISAALNAPCGPRPRSPENVCCYIKIPLKPTV